MNATHVIRIRGPWQRQVVSGGDRPRETVLMPSSWDVDLGQDFHGRVEYRRFFNKPTNVDDSTKILLAFERAVGNVTVQLNGHELGSFGWPKVSEKFDVTARLAARNELKVLIGSVSAEEMGEKRSEEESIPPGGLVGEVRLEIG